MIDDISRRELCPDGACIGVIGTDGRCKECGAVSPTVTQNPRNRGMKPESEDPPEEDFAPERQLCPDDGCVGVLGDDGVCPECGAVVDVAGDEDDGDDDEADHDPWDDEADDDDEADEADDDDDDDDEADHGEDEPDEDDDQPGGDPEFDARQLCPDGGCIGLIGANGRCKECGATAN